MITFAVSFPVLLLLVGSAIDYGYMYARRTALQGAVDAAALSGARELVLANADEKAINSLTHAAVVGNLGDGAGGVSVKTVVSFDERTVTVKATQSPGLYLMDGLTGNDDSDIAAHSTARVAGEMPICMLILHPSRRGALTMNNRSRITGNECAIYANSNSSSGIASKNGSLLTSKLTCSGGGFSGDPKYFKPVPLTDCPPIEDPLAGRRPPPVGFCDDDDDDDDDELSFSSGRRTLSPGTYCNGLAIGGSADVFLRPGIYVIKGGALKVSGKARLTGENVGFYLLGEETTFSFGPNTAIDLTAPRDGPMAGILFFEDRRNDRGNRHVIRSNGARSLVGTFYLPRGRLVIDATKPVFDESAYTVIIARRMNMFSGPNLVLNTDYDDTDIPVPPELDGAAAPGEEIVLVE